MYVCMNFPWVCMCLCMHVCIYVRTYVRMYMYVRTYVYTYECSVCMYVCMYSMYVQYILYVMYVVSLYLSISILKVVPRLRWGRTWTSWSLSQLTDGSDTLTDALTWWAWWWELGSPRLSPTHICTHQLIFSRAGAGGGGVPGCVYITTMTARLSNCKSTQTTLLWLTPAPESFVMTWHKPVRLSNVILVWLIIDYFSEEVGGLAS